MELVYHFYTNLPEIKLIYFSILANLFLSKMSVGPIINTLTEYESFYSEFQSKGPNLSNEMSFWVIAYSDFENNPHFLRTEQLKNSIPYWDWENDEEDKFPWCFNDLCNMFKYTSDELGELIILDQKIFKYYYRKIQDFRDAGNSFSENDELYADFCNYFEALV